MFDQLTVEMMTSLAQVMLIDLVLAGDNAIVIGLAAAGLPAEQRTRAILIGIGAATGLRIAFAAVTTQLLTMFGLLLAGGLLLLWVCWKMWRELRAPDAPLFVGADGHSIQSGATLALHPPQKSFLQAAGQIVIADVSMSLDNVLAVAGAAREHPWVLIFGLALSVVLMGAAAGLIARVLQRHRWIAYAGLAVIFYFYVAVDMIYRGTLEVWHAAQIPAG